MSTVTKVNFEPYRDVLHVERAVKPLADPNLANPYNAVALVDGEWLTVDTNDKWVRATDIAAADDEALKLSWPHWNEQGRTDVQALGERRTVCLWGGFWEFETRIWEDGVVGGGLALTMLNPVKVVTITIGTRNYSGLMGSQKSDTNAIHVGYVTRLPTANGGKLRIRGGMLF
jgi:hypothetical protein